jgi:small GTP-binding protein
LFSTLDDIKLMESGRNAYRTTLFPSKSKAGEMENYKIVVLGASTVGKSSILSRLIEGAIVQDRPSTVGVEFFGYKCEVDGQVVKLQIWDTAGQERFRSVSKAYFRNSLGALLVFDVGNHRSFEDLEGLFNDIRLYSHPNSFILLVGNKSDLEEREVTESELTAFADRHHLDYMETSALLGVNITESFLRVAHEVWIRVKSGQILLTEPKGGILFDQRPKSGCGC